MIRRILRHIPLLFVATVALLMSVAIFNPGQFRHAINQIFPRDPPKPIALRLQTRGFKLGQPVLVRIFKEESELEIWMKRNATFEKVFTYPICKWSGSLGPKMQEGDKQSPEGFYFASKKQLLPTSRHHRAINTGFPNSFDQSLGRTGTVLMIHGSCTSIGCYAMTHPGIDDIYTIVEEAMGAGQDAVPMHLFPFRMTEKNLARHTEHSAIAFWRNLAEGDALFAASRLPPDVWACNGKYHFANAPQNCQKVAAW
jgi:murein L,D-transpeptidase YafK